MDIFAGLVDIHMSYDGDIEFENGDLKLVSGVDYIKHLIYTVLTSDKGDWKLFPQEGGSPATFLGEQNTRETAKLLEGHLESSLAPYVIPASVTAKVIPLSYDSVKCYIDVSVLGLTVAQIPFTLDYVNGIRYEDFDETVDTVVSSKQHRFSDNKSLTNPNPYLDRIRRQ